MLAYSAVGFKLSAVSPELTLSLTQLSADLLGALVGAGALAFLVERALSEYISFPAVFPREL